MKQRIREHIEYPPIGPVPEGICHPFWSVMIPTYNRVTYLERTIRSVLEQDPGPEEMQIEVVDNCSTEGDPEAVVTKLGRERVSFYRQPKNVGVSANWNTCIDRARGHWVHILHDDDMVLPRFYSTYKTAIEIWPEVAIVFGRCELIDEAGNAFKPSKRRTESDPAEIACITSDGLFEILTGKIPATSPTVVVRRSAYEAVGGFSPNLSFTCDWEMWMRLASFGTVLKINEPLSSYRIHEHAETNAHVRNGNAIREAWIAISRGVQLLPSTQRKAAKALCRRWLIRTALQNSRQLYRQGFYTGALRNSIWSVRMRPWGPGNWRAVVRDALGATGSVAGFR